MGAVLEMIYYRYLYFLEDGRCLYALTPTPPQDMLRQFFKARLDNSENRNEDHHSTNSRDYYHIVWGQYHVQKTLVTVYAQQSWQYVRFELSIQPHITTHGRFGYLSFDTHMINVLPNWHSTNNPTLCSFDPPEEPFRFVPCKFL
jgi:hypothetical protein